MADVDLTISAAEVNSDVFQSALPVVTVGSTPPDQTGAKVAVVETGQALSARVSMEEDV